MEKEQLFRSGLHVYKKLFLVFTILVTIALNVYLVLVVTKLGIKAAISTVEYYFEPENATIPPETSLKLMLIPQSQGISFVRANIFFDPAIVKLTSEVTVNTEEFNIVVPTTTLAESNSTGNIEIALYQKPDLPALTQTFEVARFSLSSNDPNIGGETDISIIDEDSQIVDNNLNVLPFTVRYANIKVTAPGNPAEKAAYKQGQGSCPDGYIDTAIGCIPYSDTQKMAEFFLRWGVGIAGGIALILIVISSYQIMTSAGDPRKLQAGKELLTAALMGLVLLVFGAFILRTIGINILQIPGL